MIMYFLKKKKEKSVEFASSVFGLGSAFANRSNNGPASGPSGPRAAVSTSALNRGNTLLESSSHGLGRDGTIFASSL